MSNNPDTPARYTWLPRLRAYLRTLADLGAGLNPDGKSGNHLPANQLLVELDDALNSVAALQGELAEVKAGRDALAKELIDRAMDLLVLQGKTSADNIITRLAVREVVLTKGQYPRTDWPAKEAQPTPEAQSE